MYEGTYPGDDDNMDSLTDDMGTTSVGLVLNALGREQADIVQQRERENPIVHQGGGRLSCRTQTRADDGTEPDRQ